MDNFTLTSDGQGSLPVFNDKGEFVGLGVGTSRSLIIGIKDAVKKQDIPLEIAIRALTTNPAKAFKLKNKGKIERGFDADLCLLDKNLDLDTVFAKGRIMVRDKKAIVFGTFEEKE